MLAYIDKIQAAVYKLAKKKQWKRLLDDLNDELDYYREKEKVQDELTEEEIAACSAGRCANVGSMTKVDQCRKN